MVPEGQSHWHDGVSRVANDIVETDEETGRRLIARGVVAEVEAEPRPMEEEVPDVVIPQKVAEALAPIEVLPPVIETIPDEDLAKVEELETESEPVLVVDSGISLTDFPKVE